MYFTDWLSKSHIEGCFSFFHRGVNDYKRKNVARFVIIVGTDSCFKVEHEYILYDICYVNYKIHWYYCERPIQFVASLYHNIVS